ncbi:MAG: dTDP-4-dehydrorhamnose 3,5-epimerase family protein [Chloroflexi bacterium]|nr:dTDP-4-dehydrorhamnose 3,5-epimerase family protein [Chloroflexota bacterium]
MSRQDKKLADEVQLIEGGLAVDDRGTVSFVNDFNFANIKRFYTVTNHKAGFVRAWHAHRHEIKYVTVLKGAAIIGAVKIDNWGKPSKDSKAYRYVLSSDKPAVVYIPPEYANGFMSLTKDTILIFFSTATLEESRNDDVRYDAHYWDIWQITER